MAMNKYAEYTKQLRALGREAVRIQKAADRVYARGCAEVVNTLKDSLVGRWACLFSPAEYEPGTTEVALYRITSVRLNGYYRSEYRIVRFAYDRVATFHYGKNQDVCVAETLGHGYLSMYVERDFTLWDYSTEEPFEDFTKNKYVKKALKYMEDNKL